MANRPVFCPQDTSVDIKNIDFKWHPGMAVSQKKKSIASLHAEAQKEGINPILEISTKSDKKLGRDLSAFNLKILTSKRGNCFLESAYQGSKEFTKGGPYLDIYNLSAFEAKTDSRLTTSGEISSFVFDGDEWPLTPIRAFYSWLYIKALGQKNYIYDEITKYSGFTDIEFNPKKSINCQAYSAALYVSLVKEDLLEEVTKDKEHFIKFLVSMEQQEIQPSLF
jgi:hypothetical protein